MWMSFWISPSIRRLTGMCVHLLTTSAMSSSSTSSLSMPRPCFAAAAMPFFFGADLPLDLGQPAVLQLGRLAVIAGALRALDLQSQLLELFLELALALNGFLLLLPPRHQRVVLLP